MAMTYDTPTTGSDVNEALENSGLDQGTINELLETAGINGTGTTANVVVAEVTINPDGSTTVKVPEGQTPTFVVVNATNAPPDSTYIPPTGYDNIASVVFDTSSNVTWTINSTAANITGAAAANIPGTAAATADGAFDRAIASGSGNDKILVTTGENVSLDGRQGNDVLTTTSGNDSVVGGEGNDSISAGAGNDSVSGGSGNDSIVGGTGLDSIDGGTGYDYMSLQVNRDAVQIQNGELVVSGNSTIENVQFLEFSNGDTMTASQDEWYAAGMRLYETILGRSAALPGAEYWTSVLDDTQNLFTLSWSMIVSDEFQNKYGELTDEQFVTLMFQNALGRDPAQAGVDYYTDLLENEGKTRYEIATWITLSDEAAAHNQDTVADMSDEDWV